MCQHPCPMLQGFAIKKIVKYATDRDFTDVVVFNENHKQVNGMLVVHLPGGPTAHFAIRRLVLSKDIKVRGRSWESTHRP